MSLASFFTLLLMVRDPMYAFRCSFIYFNPLTPNDPYRGRTAPLTSKRCILYIYSTNIGTEHFKHCIYSPYDHLCGLVVRVSGYRYRGLGFDSRRYQIF
jgi:hypothetical protein